MSFGYLGGDNSGDDKSGSSEDEISSSMAPQVERSPRSSGEYDFLSNANGILHTSPNHTQMTEQILKLILNYTKGDELFFIRKHLTRPVVDGIVTHSSCNVLQGVKLSKLKLFSHNILIEAKCEEAGIHLSTKEQILSIGNDFYTNKTKTLPLSIFCLPIYLSGNFIGAIYITNLTKENGFYQNFNISKLTIVISSLITIINQNLFQEYIFRNLNVKDSNYIPANQITNHIIKDTHFVFDSELQEWENEFIVLTKENLCIYSSPHDTNSTITIPISSMEDIQIMASKRHSNSNFLSSENEMPLKFPKKMKSLIYIKSEGNNHTWFAISSLKAARIWYDEIKNLHYTYNQNTSICSDDIPENIRIKANDIFIDEIIGCGGAATVYIGEWHQQKVAIKKLHEFMDPLKINEYFSELKILHSLRHPNIISLMGGFIHESGRPSIVFEYASNGSLDNILRNQKILLDFDKKFDFIIQIAKALHYIHSFEPPIIHRDLKPANILLTDNWTIKLADFGLARKCDSTLTSGQGTIKWMAPELLSNQSYSIKADIYSFALIMWEIFERKPFFEEYRSNSQIEIQVVNYNARPSFSDSFPEKIKKLIVACWAQDPEKRPNTTFVLQELNSMC